MKTNVKKYTILVLGIQSDICTIEISHNEHTKEEKQITSIPIKEANTEHNTIIIDPVTMLSLEAQCEIIKFNSESYYRFSITDIDTGKLIIELVLCNNLFNGNNAVTNKMKFRLSY